MTRLADRLRCRVRLGPWRRCQLIENRPEVPDTRRQRVWIGADGLPQQLD